MIRPKRARLAKSTRKQTVDASIAIQIASAKSRVESARADMMRLQAIHNMRRPADYHMRLRRLQAVLFPLVAHYDHLRGRHSIPTA